MRARVLVLTSTLGIVGVVASACTSTPPVAVFHVPPGPSRLIPLAEDVPVLTARLHALGDNGANVVVQGNTVVVGGGGRLPAPKSFFVRTGHLTFRPVLCGAPAYVASPTVAATGHLPSCGSDYVLSSENLAVSPFTANPSHDVPPDPSFAAYLSTPVSGDDSSATELLPVGGRYPRVVVGPAQMDGSTIRTAQPQLPQRAEPWVVYCRLTSYGARQWDKTAQASFHQYLAIDLDGEVLSAPLIQPNQAAFTSFEGMVQISGTFNQMTSRQLAALLVSGPLPAPLTP